MNNENNVSKNAKNVVKPMMPRDLLVFLCLRREMKKESGVSSVSIAEMAKKTSSSPVTVLASLKRLEEAGHIVQKRRGRSNVYELQSDVAANTYDFLDKEMGYVEKQDAAIRAVYVGDGSELPDVESKMYEYVLRLESELVEMKKKMEKIIFYLEKDSKAVAMILGRKYEPINLD